MAVGVIAFLDACVLYPAVLRDVLLTLAETGIYQIRWTSDVLDEMERNLLSQEKYIYLSFTRSIARFRI